MEDRCWEDEPGPAPCSRPSQLSGLPAAPVLGPILACPDGGPCRAGQVAPCLSHSDHSSVRCCLPAQTPAVRHGGQCRCFFPVLSSPPPRTHRVGPSLLYLYHHPTLPPIFRSYSGKQMFPNCPAHRCQCPRHFCRSCLVPWGISLCTQSWGGGRGQGKTKLRGGLLEASQLARATAGIQTSFYCLLLLPSFTHAGHVY